MNTLTSATTEKDFFNAIDAIGYEGCSDGLYIPAIDYVVKVDNADIAAFLNLDTDNAEDILNAYQKHEQAVDAHFLYADRENIIASFSK